MSKFKYKYLYHKMHKVIYKLKVYDDNTYSFAIANKKKIRYQGDRTHNYDDLIKQPEIVAGALRTLKLLYGENNAKV